MHLFKSTSKCSCLKLMEFKSERQLLIPALKNLFFAMLWNIHTLHACLSPKVWQSLCPCLYLVPKKVVKNRSQTCIPETWTNTLMLSEIFCTSYLEVDFLFYSGFKLTHIQQKVGLHAAYFRVFHRAKQAELHCYLLHHYVCAIPYFPPSLWDSMRQHLRLMIAPCATGMSTTLSQGRQP